MAADRRRTRGTQRPSRRLYTGTSLFERLQQLQSARHLHLNRRETLLEMVRAVHSSLEPEEIARVVVDRCASWIPVACWSIVAPDSRGHLSLLAADVDEPDLLPPALAVAERLLETGDVLVAGDLRSDDRIHADASLAMLAFPLLGRDGPVAALVGLDRAVSPAAPVLTGGFSRAVENLLSPAGFALDAALHLKRLEALSVTDDLTRLYNARYLNMALRRETRLAHRNGRQVSVLFIDLDGFKAVNDTHGHLAGSRALIDVAGVIRGSARETDIVARFGGDEFALVLPDTGSQGALAVAERVRERIAGHSFLAADGLDIHLTASIGVATFPDAATTPDELVQAADGAMYRVKDCGKNAVQAAASSR